MTAAGNDERRPTGGGVHVEPSNQSVAANYDPGADPTLAALELVIRSWITPANYVCPSRVAFVVVVATRDGKHQRRVFLSLAAAQKAIERAEARGVDAEIMLCELRTVGGAR